MSECLFCKMVDQEIPVEPIYENDKVFAFMDINPQAPFHALIIPKTHIATVNDLNPQSAGDISELYLAAKTIASQNGFAEDGYRLVMNCNALAGQTVFHIHLHMLAKRPMNWPPG